MTWLPCICSVIALYSHSCGGTALIGVAPVECPGDDSPGQVAGGWQLERHLGGTFLPSMLEGEGTSYWVPTPPQGQSYLLSYFQSSHKPCELAGVVHRGHPASKRRSRSCAHGSLTDAKRSPPLCMVSKMDWNMSFKDCLLWKTYKILKNMKTVNSLLSSHLEWITINAIIFGYILGFLWC